MGKLGISKKRNGGRGIANLVEKLQKSLFIGDRNNNNMNEFEFDEVKESSFVPEDVKEGYFAMVAVDSEDEPKRFVVALSYLAHPRFKKLLDKAAEEYGFDQEGTLTIPCRPHEIERILLDDDDDDNNNTWDSSTSNSMLQMC